MATTDSYSTFVFTKKAVLRGISNLESMPIHEHFVGYLAILNAMHDDERAEVHSTDITDFHERYLRVVDAPDNSPYISPFRSRGKGMRLVNRNVAGSYAPSSIRSQGKITNVIEVLGEGQNAAYVLRPNHASMALKHFLKGRKVPVASLAAFLYRDFGFELPQSDVSAVIELFRREFCLSRDNEQQNKSYETLFYDDSDQFEKNDLEPIEARG